MFPAVALTNIMSLWFRTRVARNENRSPALLVKNVETVRIRPSTHWGNPRRSCIRSSERNLHVPRLQGAMFDGNPDIWAWNVPVSLLKVDGELIRYNLWHEHGHHCLHLYLRWTFLRRSSNVISGGVRAPDAVGITLDSLDSTCCLSDNRAIKLPYCWNCWNCWSKWRWVCSFWDRIWPAWTVIWLKDWWLWITASLLDSETASSRCEGKLVRLGYLNREVF